MPRTWHGPTVEDPTRSGAGGPAGRGIHQEGTEPRLEVPAVDEAPKSTVPSTHGTLRRPPAPKDATSVAPKGRSRCFAPRWSSRVSSSGARSTGAKAGPASARDPAETPEEQVKDPCATVRMLDVAPQPTRRSLFGGARGSAASSGAGAPGRVNRREVFARRAGRKAARPEIGNGRSTAVRRGVAGIAGAAGPGRTATGSEVLRHRTARLAEATAAQVRGPGR